MADTPPKVIPPTHQDNNEIVDSGTTGHFLQFSSVYMNRRLTKSLLSVALPYGSRIKLTHTTILSCPNLPKAARRAHIFSELKSVALISVIKLCDQVYKVNFTVDQVSITLENQTIITGPHDNITGQWKVPLTNPSPPKPKSWVTPPTTCQYTPEKPKSHPPAVNPPSCQ